MRIALTYNEKRSDHEDQAEFDTRAAIDGIARLVASLGHEAVPIDVSGSIPRLVVRLRQLAPELVLNLAEGERGTFREAFYPALFEQLELAHTGSCASALALSLDKALAKRVVASARVRVPHGRLVRNKGELPVLDDLDELALPVIVKPNFEGSSKGITAASVVTERGRLARVVGDALARYPEGILVEELIEGIDVAVGWIEGVGLLPAIWYRYDAVDRYAIYDYVLKHDAPERVQIEIPAPLPDDVGKRLIAATRRAIEALGIRGYGRADFRITPRGEVVFLEMNPLPSLTLATGHDELYASAARLGLSPRDVIDRIIETARPSRSEAREPVPLSCSA